MRITQLPTGTQESTDYIAVDNTSNGTRKIPVGEISSTINSPTYANGILDYALNVAPLGASVVSPRNMGSADLPSDVNLYGTAIILKRSASTISVTLITDSNQYETLTTWYSSSTWHGWKVATGAYCTSKTRWDSLLSLVEAHIGFPFSLSGTATNSIFSLGTSYYTNGVVVVNSATSATGYIVHNGNQYTFEYNPSTGTLTSIDRLVKESEIAVNRYIGNLTSSNPITITISGSTRFLMLFLGGTATRSGEYTVLASASNTYKIPVGTAPSVVTVDTATAGKIKLTSSSTGSTYVYLLIFTGAEYIS